MVPASSSDQPTSSDYNRLLTGCWPGIQGLLTGPCSHADLISHHPCPHCARLLLTSQLCSYCSLCWECTPSSLLYRLTNSYSPFKTHSGSKMPSLTALPVPRVARGLTEGCTVPAATATRTQAPRAERLTLVYICVPSAQYRAWARSCWRESWMDLVSLAWVVGKAALTILHRWEVVLLLPPWLPTNRVMGVSGADIKA